MGRVIVVGSVNADYVVRIGHLPQPGETVADGELSIRPGGKGANQAHAAARLGASVALIAAVGADAPGDDELAALRLAAVDTSGLLRRDEPTGVAMILVDDAGENMIAVAPGANRQLTAGAVTAALTGGRLDARSVVLTSLEIPLDAVASAASAARAAGATMIVNPAPGRPLAAELLAGAVLTPNEGEIRLLAPGAGTEAEAIAAVLAAGARAVVVTRGAAGRRFISPASRTSSSPRRRLPW